MKLAYAVLVALVSLQSYAHAEFAEGANAPVGPAAAAPAAAAAPKINLDEIHVTDGSLLYVMESMRRRNNTLDAEMLRNLGLCEVNKADVNVNKLPLGSIIIHRDGHPVVARQVRMAKYPQGHSSDYIQDNTPKGGWKLANIRAIYKPCPTKR
jgi:hypothetical protein